MTNNKSLITLDRLSVLDIQQLLETAQRNITDFSSDSTTKFSKKIQLNLFFENSTRTRTSFEIAGKKLGLDVINLNVATSSVKKGESLRDTLLTLNAMKPEIIVIRHSDSGAAKFACNVLPNTPIVNAGDGTHAHPTQALLDALTIKQVKGDLRGLNIAICGDILHSRVARSDIICLSKLGANVRLIAPSTLLPQAASKMNLKIFTSMKEGLRDIDVIIMLRLQTERMTANFIPSIREYNHFYGLNDEKLSWANKDCMVLHPGPVNRGVEINSQMVEHSNSYILRQVNNGIAVRMSVIEYCLNQNK